MCYSNGQMIIYSYIKHHVIYATIHWNFVNDIIKYSST